MILEPLVVPNLPEFIELLLLDVLIKVVFATIGYSEWRQSDKHREHYYAEGEDVRLLWIVSLILIFDGAKDLRGHVRLSSSR